MEDQDFACFQQLPSGLLTNPAAEPTGLWTRKRPEAVDFALQAIEMDVDGYQRTKAQLNQLGAQTLLFASITVLASVALINLNAASQQSALLLLTGSAIALLALYWVSSMPLSVALAAYASARPRREALRAAQVEFDRDVAPRQQEQIDPKFWLSLGEGGPFEQAVADLILGLYPNSAASLTVQGGQRGDRYADVIACSGSRTIIAQCKRESAAIGLAEIRQLAGAKLFFRADVAIFAALSFQSTSQINEYRERCGLTFWGADDLAAVASSLVVNRSPEMQPFAMPVSVQ